MNNISRISRPKAALVSLLAVMTAVVGVVGFSQVHASNSQDCTSNSIIKCGAATPDAFISEVRGGKQSDLKSLYSNFGLTSADYSNFISNARMGTVYKDGRVVVDGQTVATDAWSLGRNTWAGRTKVSVGGHTYYASPTSTSFASNSLSAMVLFGKDGTVKFTALNACGNPVWGHKITPKYSCDLLQETAVSGKKNTYSFSTQASASHNAKIVKLVYSFGDGTTATTGSTSETVEHTYAQAGTYTARVVVYVSLPGEQTATTTAATCEKTITIAPPKTPPVTPPATTTPPPSLPNTGPGAVIGLAAVTAFASGLLYRYIATRKLARESL